jgi:Spy/CpxP family protein refolding chaperone
MLKFSKTALVILVVFLIGTNIAVIVTYHSHLKRDLQETEQSIDIPPRQFGSFIAAELNLDDMQQTQFREFRRSYNRSANKTMASMNGIRNRMARELKAVHPDRKKLEELAGILGQKHKELKILTFDYYFNMQSVLSPEQQDKLAILFQSMLSVPGPGQGYRGERKSLNLP